MSVNRIDVLNYQFTRTLRGYDPGEVDRLLHEVADTLGMMGEEKSALLRRVSELEARLVEFREREAMLRDTLVTTQRMSEEMKQAAQKEAQLVLDTAHAKADHLLQQGALRLAKLQEDVAEARRLKTRFTLQVRAVIEQHLRLLELQGAENDADQAQKGKNA